QEAIRGRSAYSVVVRHMLLLVWPPAFCVTLSRICFSASAKSWLPTFIAKFVARSASVWISSNFSRASANGCPLTTEVWQAAQRVSNIALPWLALLGSIGGKAAGHDGGVILRARFSNSPMFAISTVDSKVVGLKMAPRPIA